MNAPDASLVGKPRPGSPAPARPLLEYAGTYRNDYHGPATIAFNGDSLTLAIGPAPLSRPLAHWDGDVFTFTLVDENASPGTISKATFAAGRVTYEYYDGKGLGTFAR